MMRALFFALGVCWVVPSVPAQEDLPSPEEFLGWKLGERFTPHGRIVDYAHRAAQSSERVTLTEYGKTPQLRPLVLLVITSEANHRRMDAIGASLEKVADPRKLAEGETAESLLADQPVVIWLSYNVHGNEASPSESALAVIHRMATADDAETRKWLDESILILDPCLNPDGRDRYVFWYEGVRGRRADPEPQSLEHQEPWPGGRTNHYQFDLNRDWAFATQIETRARLPHFHRWHPQVHVDFHEMGYESSYFFFPAEKPINSNLPPHTTKWGKKFGRGNAEAFDARGWSYYTAESFDLFYPGYGDSWPSFSGAIGMTYEQAGHGRAGALIRRRDGSVLSLRDRTDHHTVATYSTIGTAVTNRRELLADYHRFRATAIEEGREGSLRAFLVPPGADPGRADALVQMLLLQGIEIRRTSASFTLESVRNAEGRAVLDRTFEPGTYVVPLAQPLKRLAKTLLEPRAEIRELYFYDVSAWSLPLAYGVPTFQCPVAVPVDTQPVTTVIPRAGTLDGDTARVAWLLPYHTRGALESLVDLLRLGVAVRSARDGFTLNDRTYARGTLVIRSAENGKDLPGILAEVAKKRGVRIVAANSGFTEEGIDLGSSKVRQVVRPRVAVCGGKGVSSASYGATRFLLDQLLDVPHSILRLEDLAAADLQHFTAVVVPEGSVPRTAHDNLDRFARGGGVLVGFGRAAFSLMSGEKPLSRISVQVKSNKKEASPPAKPAPRWIDEKNELRRRQQQPGSIFRVELDPAHPLSFGYRTELAAFKTGTRSFDPAGPGVHVGLFKDAEPLSGYVNPKDAATLRGRAYLSVDEKGRGAVVLFADDPNFRGAWRGLSRLFLNAVLLLPQRHLPPLNR